MGVYGAAIGAIARKAIGSGAKKAKVIGAKIGTAGDEILDKASKAGDELIDKHKGKIAAAGIAGVGAATIAKHNSKKQREQKEAEALEEALSQETIADDDMGAYDVQGTASEDGNFTLTVPTRNKQARGILSKYGKPVVQNSFITTYALTPSEHDRAVKTLLDSGPYDIE